MFLARSIHADHKDLIHDVAYDFYGKRLATCSSDQSVKVIIINKQYFFIDYHVIMIRFGISVTMDNGGVHQVGKHIVVLYGR